MALRRTLTKRLTENYRSDRKAPLSPEKFSSAVVPSIAAKMKTPNYRQSGGIFRRFLHRPASVMLPEFLRLSVGERLRDPTGHRSSGDQILMRIGAMTPSPLPPPLQLQDKILAGDNALSSLSVSEIKKILKMHQVERLKAKLREIPKSCISQSEFLKICAEDCGNDKQGSDLAKSLDDSGSVIVLGDAVFLRPEQMVKSIETMINETSSFPDDPRKRELVQLERTKAMIDQKAQNGVKAELYSGLCLLAIQMIGFMRLTFWELSWDVMEPICFFVTSLHFFIGYTFFLRTSTEPSFEGYFRRRFRSKQRKFMEMQGFDIERYNELKKLFYSSSSCRCSFCCSLRTTDVI